MPPLPAEFHSRWCPRWCGALLLAAWAAGAYAVLLPHLVPVDGRCLVALGPLVLVTGYAVSLFACNTTRARVSERGVQLSHGPLPGGPAPLDIPAASIRRCYFRQTRFPTIAGAIRYHAAGVETAEGARHDLVSGFPAEHDARFVAEAIADAMPEPRPPVLEAIGGASAKASFRPVLVWSAAILTSLAWVIAVDALL